MSRPKKDADDEKPDREVIAAEVLTKVGDAENLVAIRADVSQMTSLLAEIRAGVEKLAQA
jgi:hypothetical protein